MISNGDMVDKNQQLDFLLNYLIDERQENIEIPSDIHEKQNLLRALMNVRPAIPISDEFLEVQDEYLTDEILSKDLVSVTDIADSKGKLMLWKGDIVELKVDAIVNAANSQLLGCFIPLHNCIDNVIHSASGVQLRLECNRIMKTQAKSEDVGKAKITNAYNLPSKYVIHTVGSAIPYGTEPSNEDCEKKSVAFCCISTGVFNFPKKSAAEIAVKTVNEYLNNNETSLEYVIFNVFDDDSYSIYKNLLFGD